MKWRAGRPWPDAVLQGRPFLRSSHDEPRRGSSMLHSCALGAELPGLDNSRPHRRDKHSGTGKTSTHRTTIDTVMTAGSRPTAPLLPDLALRPLGHGAHFVAVALTRPGRACGSGKVITAHCIASRRGNLRHRRRTGPHVAAAMRVPEGMRAELPAAALRGWPLQLHLGQAEAGLLGERAEPFAILVDEAPKLPLRQPRVRPMQGCVGPSLGLDQPIDPDLRASGSECGESRTHASVFTVRHQFGCDRRRRDEVALPA